MIPQPIIDIAEICARKGVVHAIISPGSRNAPITIAFARHPGIRTHVVPDERSAGFIALGLSQYSDSPVVLICTSGSAVYNYSPAIAEAFYSHIPLIVLSADRPPEWIDQKDGQTIHQGNIFGDHIKQSLEFPDTYDHADIVWHCHRTINEAINVCNEGQRGPVHVNIPLREPFYPEPGQEIKYSSDLKIIEENLSKSTLGNKQLELLTNELLGFKKVLIVFGQMIESEELDQSTQTNFPIVSDVISNYISEDGIRYHDLFLNNLDEETLKTIRPDLLITIGGNTISKSLKTFIRKNKPTHWHIQEHGQVADTFQSLTRVVRVPSKYFLENILSNHKGNHAYRDAWRNLDSETSHEVDGFLSNEFWELKAVDTLIKNLPNPSHLHLGNSMPVRWANFIGRAKSNVRVFCNRGTSGIDGSLSTAVGYAFECDDLVVAIIGDMSFFYDRNGLWHNHLPKNLRIVVLNNHGGGIFRLIDGPSKQPELDEYFETTQKLNARNTTVEFGLRYYEADSSVTLDKAIPDFFKMDGKAKLLEIQTDSKQNKVLFEELKSKVQNKLKSI